MEWRASDEEEEEDEAFMWIEGDSLAPPCQSDHDIVDQIIQLAKLTTDDV